MNYVLDTNIITAILKDNENVKNKISQAILEGSEIYVNGITYYEIKRGLLAINANTILLLFDQFCRKFPILLFDAIEIFDEAAEIYAFLQKKRQPIGDDADILIASIVKLKDFTLVTDNVAHFQRIEGLRFENWLR